MQFKPSIILKIIYACFLLHVYQYILYSVLSFTWVTHLEKTFSTFTKWLPGKFVNNIIIWFHFLLGFDPVLRNASVLRLASDSL